MRISLIISLVIGLTLSMKVPAQAGEPLVDTTFSGVSEIVITNMSDNAGVTITDRAIITNLTKTITLVPKEPCKCEHTDVIWFQKAASRIYVHLCDHCFVIRDNESDKNYWFEMPKAFLAAYQTVLRNAKKQNPTNKSSLSPGSPSQADL